MKIEAILRFYYILVLSVHMDKAIKPRVGSGRGDIGRHKFCRWHSICSQPLQSNLGSSNKSCVCPLFHFGTYLKEIN